MTNSKRIVKIRQKINTLYKMQKNSNNNIRQKAVKINSFKSILDFIKIINTNLKQRMVFFFKSDFVRELDLEYGDVQGKITDLE